MSETQTPYKIHPQWWQVSNNGSGAQAELFDISFWARTGGTDWPRAKENMAAVIIRAGQGFYRIDELLAEHMRCSIDVELPAHTYWQIDPRENIYTQADKYLSGEGVRGRKKCVAWEVTGGGLSSWADVKAFCNYLQESDPSAEVYIYSRIRIMIEAKLSTEDVAQFNWLIAQYPYEDGYTEAQYTRFGAYLADHPYEYPADVERFGKQAWEPYIIAHQFTEKLDARYYFANDRTDDPAHRSGLHSGDGIVSMTSKIEFMAWFTGEASPPIEPPPPAELQYCQVRMLIDYVNLRSQPTTNSAQIGRLYPAQIGVLQFPIRDEHLDGEDHWFEIDGAWVAYKWRSPSSGRLYQFMEIV